MREIVSDGTTLLLTTQYLEEADALADEILVIDHGRELARGTADSLKSRVGGERIELTVSDPNQGPIAVDLVRPYAVGEVTLDAPKGAVSFQVDADADPLPATVRALDEAGVRLAEMSLRRASLDDVFLALTGRTTEGSAEQMKEAT